MDFRITFENGASGYLIHHGVRGMHWGVRNAETQAKYANAGVIGRHRIRKEAQRTYKNEMADAKLRKEKSLESAKTKKEMRIARRQYIADKSNAQYKRDVATYGATQKQYSKAAYHTDRVSNGRIYTRTIAKDLGKNPKRTHLGAIGRQFVKSAAVSVGMGVAGYAFARYATPAQKKAAMNAAKKMMAAQDPGVWKLAAFKGKNAVKQFMGVNARNQRKINRRMRRQGVRFEAGLGLPGGN